MWLISAVFLALAAFLFAIAGAPARLLAWAVSSSQLSATGYSGTLWDGRAASMAIATPAGPMQLGSVRWSVAPGSLFSLAPTARWHSQWGNQELQGQVRWLGGQSLALSDVEFTVDAGVLRRLLPLTVSGRFSGLLPEIIIENNRLVSLLGQVSWSDAVWRDGDKRFSLGSYAVEFRPGAKDSGGGRGDAIGGTEGEVITLEGPLMAAGEFTLDRDGLFALGLTLDSERPLAPPLERALSLVAAPQDDGFYLQLQGNLYPTPREPGI
ncbi:MAG: type II secretion system protein N [Chromatocurvus sp.]